MNNAAAAGRQCPPAFSRRLLRRNAGAAAWLLLAGVLLRVFFGLPRMA